MKGTAHIVVKDKYGKIKTDVTEHNTITDAYKNILTWYLSNLPEVSASTTNSGITQTYFPEPSQKYFDGIMLHEKACSDDKDIPLPVLIGGQTAKSNSTNNAYSVASSVVKNKDKIQNIWSWTAEKALTIRSMCLHDSDFVNSFVFDNAFAQLDVWNLTNTKRLAVNAYSYGNNSGYYFGTKQTNVSLIGENIGNFTRLNNYSSTFRVMYGNETAMFVNSNDNTTTFADVWVRICVLNNADVDNYANATPKRSFAKTQFNGLTTSYNYDLTIVPTPENDYLVMFYNKQIKVWIIPRTASTDTIEPIFTATTTFADAKNHVRRICGRLVLLGLNGNKCVFLRIDYDNNAPVITYSEIEANTAPKTYYYDSYGSIYYSNDVIYANILTEQEVVSPYVAESLRTSETITDMENYPLEVSPKTYHNHTILNLSTPISIAAGDVLTVSYSISVV